MGKKITYVSVSNNDTFKAMKDIGLDDWLINMILEGYSNLRKGYFSPVTSVVEEITGKKPIFSKTSQRIKPEYLDNRYGPCVEIFGAIDVRSSLSSV